MANPIQHITCLTTAQRLTINADYPTGIANVWTGTVVTDPSTNNQPLGRPIRNMLNSNDPTGDPVPRVVRSGGSGRPQIREYDGAAPAGCSCSQYTGSEGEFDIDFIICSYETFPLDFTARWGGSAGGTLIAPGPNPPTQSEINAIWQLVNSSADEPISVTTSATCDDLGTDILTAYYRFENNLLDSSPTGADLSDLGGTTYGTGKINQGLTAGGGSFAGLIGDVFTVGVWLYDDGAINGIGAGFYILDDASLSAFYVHLNGIGGGVVHLKVDGLVTYDLGPALAGWNHVAFAYDGGSLNVYLNGEFVSSAPVRSAGTALDGVQLQAGDEYNGKSDEAGVWNVQLSALQVHVLYHGGDGFDPTA